MKEIKDLGLKTTKDLQKMELSNLGKELIVSKRKLFELKMKLKLGEFKQTHLVKSLRRYIATLSTIIVKKQINTL